MTMLADPGTSCAPMGRLEYVVESRCRDRLQRWFVVRPHVDLADRYEALGISLSPGCRVVIEAESMRPVGVLAKDVPEPPPAAGYNPYYDPPIS